MATIINYKINQNNFFCMVSLNHSIGRYRPQPAVQRAAKFANGAAALQPKADGQATCTRLLRTLKRGSWLFHLR